MKTVRSAFIELRHRLKFTQQQMAEKIGLHASHLSNMETGVRNPTQRTLKRVWEYASSRSHHDLAEVFENAIGNTREATHYRERENDTATLRDQFAMAALNAITTAEHEPGFEASAKAAYQYADAMLKERSRDRKA